MTTPRPDGCESFEELLPDYLDGALDGLPAELAAAHLGSCARCTELVRELEEVRDRANALPVLRPSRDLWPQISARISAPVQSLDSHRARSVPRFSTGALRRYAVAASLVVVTAGVTYIATRLTTPTSVPVRQVATQPTQVVPVVHKQSAADTYDEEITQLHKIVAERQDQLDPRTVAEIQRNLAVIDSAIAESRRALRKDPKSAFLADQLDHALDNKMELLRTAALLPART
jgi:Putative zinc-finger